MNEALPTSTASTDRIQFRIVRTGNAHPTIDEPDRLRMVSPKFNLCSALEYIAVLVLTASLIATLSLCLAAFVRF